MPRRSVQFRPLKKLSIGDMRECISLENRAIASPDFDSVAFEEDYTQIIETWAKVETNLQGRVFAGVEIEDTPSHRFTIRFRETVTTETRIRYKERFFRIIQINNFEERDEYLELLAREDGADNLEVSR